MYRERERPRRQENDRGLHEDCKRRGNTDQPRSLKEKQDSMKTDKEEDLSDDLMEVTNSHNL